MTLHEEIQELIPAYALGALGPDEAARVKAHLDSCARCTLVLKEYAPVAESLAFSVPLREPPADLKARTMRHAVKQDSPGASPPTVAQARRLNLRPIYALAGAAFVIVLLAVGGMAFLLEQFSQQLETQRAFTTTMAYASGEPLSVHGTSLAPQAEGRLYADGDGHVAAMVMVDLPQLPPGSVYQAWLWQPDGSWISGGMFTVDRSGSGWVLVHTPQPMSTYTSLGITVERAGGAAAPTTRPVLATKLALQ